MEKRIFEYGALLLSALVFIFALLNNDISRWVVIFGSGLIVVFVVFDLLFDEHGDYIDEDVSLKTPREVGEFRREAEKVGRIGVYVDESNKIKREVEKNV